MVELLKFIDELRSRGAIKITTPEVSVEFSAPLITPALVEDTQLTFTPDVKADDIDALMYKETSNL